MKNIIFLLLLIIATGCNQDSISKTKELNANNTKINQYNLSKNSNKDINKSTSSKENILIVNSKQKLEQEKIKFKNQKELLVLSNQNQQKLKELDINSKKELAKIELEKRVSDNNRATAIADIANKTKLKVNEKQNSTFKIIAILITTLLIIWLLLRYLLARSKRKLEHIEKEKELNNKVYLEGLKLKYESFNKMLEIISDEKCDKDIKKSLTKVLEKNRNILENR